MIVMKTIENFTEGPILKQLVTFAAPVFLAHLLQTMYGAVDLLVVGRYGDASNVSAVAVGTMVMQNITFMITDIAMGATILIARLIGAKKESDCGKVIGADIMLFIGIAVFVTISMQYLARPVAVVLKAPPEALEGTIRYIRICCAGSVFIVAYNVIGAVFRGMGNSVFPLIGVAVACLFNVIGDVLFVKYLGLAEAGAALATIMAQAISVVFSYCLLRRMDLPFLVKIKWDGKSIMETLRLGLPIAATDLLVGISFLVITAIVNSMGLIASAGMGVAEKLCAFIMLVPSSFMQSMSAFVAQNIGAGKRGRANDGLKCSICLSLCVGIVMSVSAFLFGENMSMIFTTDKAVAAASADYLKVYAIDTILVSFLFSLIGYFNGLGKTKFLLLQGLIGAFGVRIPVSFIMSRQIPPSLFKVGLATPCSSIVQILIIFTYYLILNRAADQQNQLSSSMELNCR